MKLILVTNLVPNEPIRYHPRDIDPYLCTHIVYAFSILNSETLNIESADKWTDIDNKYYEGVTSLKDKNDVKVLLALNGMNDAVGDKYGRLLQDETARKNFIESIVIFIQKHNFDGLDLDLEVG